MSEVSRTTAALLYVWREIVICFALKALYKRLSHLTNFLNCKVNFSYRPGNDVCILQIFQYILAIKYIGGFSVE